MMFFTSMVQSIAEMVRGFFDWRTSLSNNEISHEVIEDKQDCEKACAYALHAFRVVNENAIFKNKFARARYKYFEKKFNDNK